MAAAAIPVKGKPGQFYIPSLGETFKAQELTEDSFYDTVTAASGAVPTSALRFFDTLSVNGSSKNKQHTNITTTRRTPSNTEFSMTRLGVVIAQAVGNSIVTDSDIIKASFNGALRFFLGRQEIANGPLWKYPGGYGVVGNTVRTGTGIVTNGVASPAATPPLVVTQPVSWQDDLDGDLRFDTAAWITNYVGAALDGINAYTLDLHGIKKVAVSR
jgi:hypothetical protein